MRRKEEGGAEARPVLQCYFESDNWKADWLNDVDNGVIIPGWYYTIDLEDLA